MATKRERERERVKMKFSYLLLTLLVLLLIFGSNHLLVEAGKKHHNKGGGLMAPKFGSIKSGTVVLDFNSAQGKAQKFKH